jgi:hypothetical protein
MIRVILNIWRWPVNSMVGVLFGVVLATWVYFYSPNLIGPLSNAWDERYPVVKPVSAEVIARENDAVIVRIVADKQRGEECIILRIYASAIGPDGLPALASARRPDGTEHAGVSHEAGVRDFGVWRIKPVIAGSRAVIVYTEHSCLGRVAKSKIAEVKL